MSEGCTSTLLLATKFLLRKGFYMRESFFIAGISNFLALTHLISATAALSGRTVIPSTREEFTTDCCLPVPEMDIIALYRESREIQDGNYSISTSMLLLRRHRPT